MHTNKYKEYKTIDFLKDDDFLRWNLFRLEKDSEYWTKVMTDSPEIKYIIENAIELYKTNIQLNNYSLTSEQIDIYHDDLQHRISKCRKQKRIYYWGYSAASILILLTVLNIYRPFSKQESNLLNFVKENTISEDSISKNIQLYVSADQVINIEEQEADITYNTDSIHVTGKSLIEVNNTMEYSQLIVPKGKRSKLILSDGSTLHLNSGTRVVYPNYFAGNMREIYVNGEVYLDVSHNNKKPFIVRTNTITVRVMGTQFNVQAYEEDTYTQVVLASGAVQVKSNIKSGKIDLIPSQMYDYKDGQASVIFVDVEKYTSWVRGMIYLDNEPLSVLITKLSRYYGEEIIFDKELAIQKCSGKIDLKDNLEEVLSGLAFSFPIKVSRDSEGYKVNSR